MNHILWNRVTVLSGLSQTLHWYIFQHGIDYITWHSKSTHTHDLFSSHIKWLVYFLSIFDAHSTNKSPFDCRLPTIDYPLSTTFSHRLIPHFHYKHITFISQQYLDPCEIWLNSSLLFAHCSVWKLPSQTKVYLIEEENQRMDPGVVFITGVSIATTVNGVPQTTTIRIEVVTTKARV